MSNGSNGADNGPPDLEGANGNGVAKPEHIELAVKDDGSEKTLKKSVSITDRVRKISNVTFIAPKAPQLVQRQISEREVEIKLTRGGLDEPWGFDFDEDQMADEPGTYFVGKNRKFEVSDTFLYDFN